MNARIPDVEYRERIAKAAKMIAEKGLDALVVNSTESDYANVRYFSGLYTIWERTGVLISASGKAVMLVGPEGLAYTQDVSRIKEIYSLREYRESADPAYPELKTYSFKDAFGAVGLSDPKLKIGIASHLDTNMAIYLGLQQNFPEAELVVADDILIELRRRKSPNELACLKEVYRTCEIAIQYCLENIKPGMSECAIVGLAQKAILENGAEYEGMPHYIFSDRSSRHALSRPSPDRIVNKNSFLQLNISARVDGYSGAIGIPISLGKFTPRQKEMVQFGWDMHVWAKNQVKPGALSGRIAKDYYNLFTEKGHEENFLYGPLHGLGMIEVEAPWVEQTSTYLLETGFCYQIDTFAIDDSFGLRWEEGLHITEGGYEIFNKPLDGALVELGF
ncbi:MAG: M24 family metallopeptidase [Treponema sp.]|jgi:Xaa-Pro aminopeptidase|nr:M24 family metallopeptidase [Treponema sp.]